MKKLRKILSVLALIVLVGSDFLTSFSYALDDMLEDSVVVQTENEEETESVENEEDNVDEEDTEFAYEDESIEEELETENLTGDIVEEGTGKVSEIGSGEVEELTEETVEGVTGDIIEELTGDVEELTGDVDESTEIGEETVIEEITYNEEPIIGEETYNDVTVRVEALSGIFPEGTELKIEPIKWWNLSSLRDKLVEEKEEIEEDTTVVAFDITFKYEGEEVQPKEGEKVKVTFDYSKNENLLEADKNENQEVKVYHIEDMDNNGEKVNQGEEVVKDVTNKVESEEEGIAVVDAESFSIYAVVTTTGNPDSVTVTHYLNGGYWMEDHSTESKPIVYTCINNSCTTTTHYKTPSKDGYMFMGWINGSGNRRKDGVATDGMSVYAKWQKFGDLNVYILGSDNDSDKHQYTLMDRNMGALDIYNKSGTINDESRGYYYQWGNNYGFDSHYENSGALSETTKQKVDVANYSWEFPYYGYKFYLNGAKEYANWMSGSVNKSLWGDGNITSKEAKQGPCPAGYYIPSKNDWQGLLVSWNSVNSRAEKNFYFDFLVPSAGIRDRGYQQGNGSKVVDIERYRYASSSRNNNDTKTKAVITLTQTEMDKVPIVSPSSNNNNLSHERGSNGLSVRCFKNVTGSIINISDIDLNGGQKAIISIDSGEVVSLQNPVRNSDEFRGWYTTSNFSGNPIGVGSGLSVGDKLYARRCADGLVDDGTQCIDGYSITFDSNGGSPVATQTVSPLGTGTRPTDPTKMGYVFTGWFLTGAIEEFDFTGTQITGNITLYAHWNTGESYFKINCNKKKLDVDNNQLLDKSDPYLTGIVITGATDSEIILADYSNRCNLAGYEYTGAMVYGSDDGSGSKLSTTTLLADGTRVIEMYFQPVQNQFTLNSADYTITVGSSQNGLYYYGAKVTLSGDSSDDCFEWNEWNGLPEGTTSSAQTSFSMPNDSVTVTPSVKENTYNIIFSGNGSSSGEMSRINEVRCTESIQLTPNAFGKTGYTFTGWSRASGENTREYSDGQTVSGLSKTNLDNVTLYAVWDKNKYIVTGSVAEGQENMGYLSGNTSTGASLIGLYDFGTNLIFIAIPELGYVFDYWKNGDTILSGTDLGDGTNQLTVIVDQILDIIAFFKPAENTPYTVEHYKQNLTQDGYEFAWSGTMYGTTNESTNATGTDYEGFTLSGSLVSYQTGINADGSTVVRLYYDRNTYTVMWDMWEGYPSWTVKKFDVIYGSHPVFEWDDVDQYTPKRGRDPRTDDIKYDFTFTGWVKSGSSEIIKDLTTQIVTGDVRYVAQYDTGYRYYEVRYHTDEGTGTMEPQSLQLYSSGTLNKNKFIRTGYIFSGWWYEYSDGIEVFYEDEQEINLGVEDGVLKSGGEWEDPLYLDVYAQWKPSTDTKVTVNYYLKDLDKENNVLIDSRTEYAIGVEFTGTTDSVIDSILTRYGTGINGYEYSKSIVYGTDYPSGVETGTTTILADGSRKIDMYYVPVQKQFTLNSANHTSTVGSSQNGLYYYGAKVTLSGDSSDDCFTWSGWMTSGITLSDVILHQTGFAMPANDVEATPSTTENTYNIIFNGNGSNSGTMSPMNGVRCTESTGLTLNSFERDGYTFTGWSETSGGSRDYVDGATVDRLSTGADVNLYAVWDVNHYTVTFDLNGGNLTGDMTETKDYTIETSSISLIDYEPERNGYTFTGWYRNDILVNSIAGGETGDYTLVARWEAQRRPVPVVVYKKMLIPGEWSEYESELMWGWGTVGELYTAPLENFTPTGFHYEEENDSNRRTVVVDPDLRNEVAIFFVRNLYPVIIDNAGEGRSSDTSGSSDYLYEEPVTISVTPYTGWEFINWTLIQGTLSGITDWTQRTLSFNMPAEQVMISPILDHISYTVSFDTASGTAIEESQSYYYNDYLSDLDNAVTTRIGYDFDGWYLSGVLYTSGSTMPAENITLIAKWVPCTGIQYQVNHRGENTGDNNYEVLLSGYIMYGTSDTQTIAKSEEFAGFTLSGNVEQKAINPNGTTEVNIYYNRNVYTISLDNNGGTGVSEITGKYQAPLIVSNPTKSGYEFVGWNPELPMTIPNYNYTGIAMWSPSTGEYKVEFYYQLSDGTYPSTATSGESRIGTTEGIGSVRDVDKESTMGGYVFDSTNTGNVLEGEIVGDGSLVLKVYFKKQFTVRYLTGSHGIFSEDIHTDLDYGIGTPVFRGNTGSHDSGYTFNGWIPEWTGIVTNDVDYEAQWIADTDTEFKVEYYLQNVEDDGYTFIETGVQTGTTNTTGYADATKGFTGFAYSGGNENNITSGVIAGDGSLVLKLYYDRNEYTVTTGEVENGSISGETGSQRYGKRIRFTVHAAAGYRLKKWLRDGVEVLSGGVVWTGEELEIEIGTGMEIGAEFEARNDTPYYVEYYKENLDGGYDVWTGTYSGTTDQEATAQELTFTGFTYDSGNVDNITTGNIDGDGSRVLKLYYNREIYTITWLNEDGTDMDTTTVKYGEVPTHAAPTQPADAHYTYVFKGWDPEPTAATGGVSYRATYNYIVNKYTITWRNDDGSLIDTTEVEYGVVPTHANPGKADTEDYRYTFAGWTPNLVAVVGDAEYTATFTAEEKEKPSKGGNMSGGGGRKSNTDDSDNRHGSAEENSDGFTGDIATGDIATGDVDDETLSLYQRARENDITTMDTVEEANPDGLLTRGHMAKMVVNFVKNVLGKPVPSVYPDKCNWKDKESERESEEIKIYAKKACSLGLMGIYVEEFMPNKILDRAEFGTIVSRLLWGDRYNILDTDHRSYYEDHLWALKRQGILTQTDNPEDRWEIRKWVWLVFRRISEKLNK